MARETNSLRDAVRNIRHVKERAQCPRWTSEAAGRSSPTKSPLPKPNPTVLTNLFPEQVRREAAPSTALRIPSPRNTIRVEALENNQTITRKRTRNVPVALRLSLDEEKLGRPSIPMNRPLERRTAVSCASWIRKTAVSAPRQYKQSKACKFQAFHHPGSATHPARISKDFQVERQTAMRVHK